MFSLICGDQKKVPIRIEGSIILPEIQLSEIKRKLAE